MNEYEWDVFISHASEDKDTFVRPLAAALGSVGLRIWYDEQTLVLGDSLRRKIDQGLLRSRHGVVFSVLPSSRRSGPNVNWMASPHLKSTVRR
jgi:hypothetical protein